MERVITYIDGFNLYFGLKSKNWKRFYWQNLQLLGRNLLKNNQILLETKYFTAFIKIPPQKAKRQKTYLEALKTLKEFSFYFGKYYVNPKTCNNCGFTSGIPNEKMTDVNIAVEILADAFNDKFDTAILISADSDLTAPIKKIKELYPAKKIICAFPPDRFSFELSVICNGYFTIGRKKFAASIFPNEVFTSTGFKLVKPASWS